jgi:hypothetical protein
MMKFISRVFAGVVLVASPLFAMQVSIAFKDIGGGPVPAFIATPGSDLDLAKEAFFDEYGREAGLRGVAVGTRSELLVLTDRWSDARRIFNDMQRRGDIYEYQGMSMYQFTPVSPVPPITPGGAPCAQENVLICPIGQIDACVIPNSNASHHFCVDEQQSQASGYVTYGTMNIEENSRGYFSLVYGLPAIRSFKLLMDRNCHVDAASVVKLDSTQIIEPTRLLGVQDQGAFHSYEFAVNGGYGTRLKNIAVDMARHGGPVVIDVCPVTLLVRY